MTLDVFTSKIECFYRVENFKKEWVEEILWSTKGQLISKANCQAKNSSKKRTNEFVFTTMQRVFVPYLEEIEVNKKTFRN